MVDQALAPPGTPRRRYRHRSFRSSFDLSDFGFRKTRWSMTFHHLVRQLSDLRSGLRQCGLAHCRDRVVLAHLPADHAILAVEIAVSLQAMQQRVDGPRTDLIPVP